MFSPFFSSNCVSEVFKPKPNWKITRVSHALFRERAGIKPSAASYKTTRHEQGCLLMRNLVFKETSTQIKDTIKKNVKKETMQWYNM